MAKKKFNIAQKEDELLEALVKVATGGEYETMTQKIMKGKNGDSQALEQEKVTQQIPPNPEIAQWLLETIDKEKYSMDRIKKDELRIKAEKEGVFL